MTASRRCDLLGCYHHVIHLCGFRCLGYLLVLCVCAYLMHVDMYGCAISLFPVAALCCLLESCLRMPVYAGLGLLLDFVAFEVFGALSRGVYCLWSCYAGVVCTTTLLC
jgi:hypothetical protein